MNYQFIRNPPGFRVIRFTKLRESAVEWIAYKIKPDF